MCVCVKLNENSDFILDVTVCKGELLCEKRFCFASAITMPVLLAEDFNFLEFIHSKLRKAASREIFFSLW